MCIHVYYNNYRTCACKYTCTVIVLFLQVTVKYIDYGTEEEYEPSRLRKARTDNPLHSLPPQAIKCKLHGLPTHKVTRVGAVCMINIMRCYFRQKFPI